MILFGFGGALGLALGATLGIGLIFGLGWGLALNIPALTILAIYGGALVDPSIGVMLWFGGILVEVIGIKIGRKLKGGFISGIIGGITTGIIVNIGGFGLITGLLAGIGFSLGIIIIAVFNVHEVTTFRALLGYALISGIGFSMGTVLSIALILLFNRFYEQLLILVFLITPFLFFLFISPLLYPLVFATEIIVSEKGRKNAWLFHFLAFIFSIFTFNIWLYKCKNNGSPEIPLVLSLFIMLIGAWVFLLFLRGIVIQDYFSLFALFTSLLAFSFGEFIILLAHESSALLRSFLTYAGIIVAILDLFALIWLLTRMNIRWDIIPSLFTLLIKDIPFFVLKKLFLVLKLPIAFIVETIGGFRKSFLEKHDKNRLIQERADFLAKQFKLDPEFLPFLKSFLRKYPSFLKEQPNNYMIYMYPVDGGWTLLGRYLEWISSIEPMIDLKKLAFKFGLKEKLVIEEVQRLIDAELLQGKLFSHVFVSTRKEQLMGLLKETSELFNHVRDRVLTSSVLSKDDEKNIQNLLIRFRVMLELSKELQISMIEELTQDKIRELKELITKYQSS